jgi:hypothetical protein
MEDLIDNDDDAGVESSLAQEVTALWGEHVRVSGLKKASAAELRLVRAKLAERLFEVKALLSRRGRGGQWRAWLTEANIPRSTADRLVERHGESLGGITNVPNESISPEEQVKALVMSTLPRLRKVLVTPDLAHRFVVSLAGEFHLIGSYMGNSVLLALPDAEQEPPCDRDPYVDEPCTGEAELQPPLHQYEPTAQPEPSLQQDEPINPTFPI